MPKNENTHVKIQLRKVNLACFPVSYNDAFYRSVVTLKDEDLCKFAYWNGFVVGAVCTRVEPHPDRYVLLLFVCIHIFKSVICVLFLFFYYMLFIGSMSGHALVCQCHAVSCFVLFCSSGGYARYL